MTQVLENVKTHGENFKGKNGKQRLMFAISF